MKSRVFGEGTVKHDVADSCPKAEIPADLLKLLCCPKCRGDLRAHLDEEALVCPRCGFTFPIIDGIPVLLPVNVREKFDELFDRHWDSKEMAELYDRNVEGKYSAFGMYVHVGERDATLNVMGIPKPGRFLDCGCGNGRFLRVLPKELFVVAVDASLNMLRIVKRYGSCPRLVCCELEHLPFKDDLFDTVLSVRVIQHIREQEKAVSEINRVCAPGGDVVLHLYNNWCTKGLVKKIRESRWGEVLNAPFKWFFKSLRPFSPWPLAYDQYNNAPQIIRWLKRDRMCIRKVYGAGFSFNKWLLNDFWIITVLEKHSPSCLSGYLKSCLFIESHLGRIWPMSIFMEKFVIKAEKPR